MRPPPAALRRPRLHGAVAALCLVLAGPVRAEAPPAQGDTGAAETGIQPYLTLRQYGSVRMSLDQRANALVGAYVMGLSDGIFAHEMSSRRRTGQTTLCFADGERRPTREEALAIVDRFVERLQAARDQRPGVDEFPMLTVVQIAYQDAFACDQNPMAPAAPAPAPVPAVPAPAPAAAATP